MNRNATWILFGVMAVAGFALSGEGFDQSVYPDVSNPLLPWRLPLFAGLSMWLLGTAMFCVWLGFAEVQSWKILRQQSGLAESEAKRRHSFVNWFMVANLFLGTLVGAVFFSPWSGHDFSLALLSFVISIPTVVGFHVGFWLQLRQIRNRREETSGLPSS